MQSGRVVKNNWIVQRDLLVLFEFVLPIFESIFGQAVMSNEPCEVYIDTACMTAPIFTFNPTRIILTTIPTDFCNVIFQLAHELTHYAIRQSIGSQYISCASAAFEESAAEAMSLYILNRCSEQWESCAYYMYNQGFAAHLKKYKNDYYDNTGGKRPDSYGEWFNICIGFSGGLTSGAKRPDVSIMRNVLYDAFIKLPSDIGSLIKYPLYMRGAPFEKMIDENKWKASEPTKAIFIDSICAIQPAIASSSIG